MHGIKALAFDTGGTVLDWHGGLVEVLTECGARRGFERDWHGFANEYRRRSLKQMLGALHPDHNIDDVHRSVLDELLAEERMDAFSPEDRIAVAQRWHELVPGRILRRHLRACRHGTFAYRLRSSACPWSSMSRGATGSAGMQ